MPIATIFLISKQKLGGGGGGGGRVKAWHFIELILPSDVLHEI